MNALARWWSRPIIRWVVGITISVLSIYLALRNISLGDLKSSFRMADWRYMGLGLLSVIAGLFAKVSRWRILLGKPGQQVSFKRLTISHLAGQSLNMIYPARVGDLSRVYVIGEEGVSRTFVLGTVILEKLWDMLSYTLIFFLLLLVIPLPNWISDSVYGLSSVTVIFVILSFIISYQRVAIVRYADRVIKWVPEGVKGRLMAYMHSGLKSLDVLQSRKEILRLTFWSTLIWGTAILNNQLVLMALRIHLPITASVLVLVALQAGISIPSIPGRIGIFQYICILALGVFGVDQTMALSYSILLHSVALLSVLFAGLVCAWVLGIMKPATRIPVEDLS
jgi:uncharacterized protein (TIRG00374 family)